MNFVYEIKIRRVKFVVSGGGQRLRMMVQRVIRARMKNMAGVDVRAACRRGKRRGALSARIMRAIMGRSMKRRALWCHAVGMSAWSSACMALCVPHPGHCSPVRVWKGHRGKKPDIGSIPQYIRAASVMAARVAMTGVVRDRVIRGLRV